MKVKQAVSRGGPIRTALRLFFANPLSEAKILMVPAYAVLVPSQNGRSRDCKFHILSVVMHPGFGKVIPVGSKGGQ